MADPVRRGGRGRLPDGAQLTWSLAEGGRGRRWRASRVRDGRLEGTILLEIDASGRPARLELDTPVGLLTLHPDGGERELHGNVVTPDGIRHLRFDWGPVHELVVDGFPVVLLAAARRLAADVPVGKTAERPALIVDSGLRCHVVTIRLVRLDEGRWRAEGEGSAVGVAIDADGAPAGLDDAADWPLEA
jgi:hypothetical protein